MARKPVLWGKGMTYPRSGRRLLFRLTAGVFLVLSCWARGAAANSGQDPNKRDFTIPAGSAEYTLGLFAEQAGVQFVYSADKVRGVRTNALKGQYPPKEALTLIVAGTPLQVVQDESTGALTVDRRSSARISRVTEEPKKKIP